jgi:hypothetical protein
MKCFSFVMVVVLDTTKLKDLCVNKIWNVLALLWLWIQTQQSLRTFVESVVEKYPSGYLEVAHI